MRHLPDVLRSMLKEIPESEKSLRQHLSPIIESAEYAAPELMQRWWIQTANVLAQEVPTPIDDWQIKVKDIFIGNKS